MGWWLPARVIQRGDALDCARLPARNWLNPYWPAQATSSRGCHTAPFFRFHVASRYICGIGVSERLRPQVGAHQLEYLRRQWVLPVLAPFAAANPDRVPRYPALAGRARTGSFRKYLPMSAATSEGVAYRLERSFSKALRVIASRSPRNCRARVGASAPRFCAVIPVCAPSVRSLVLGRAASSSRNRRGN